MLNRQAILLRGAAFELAKQRFPEAVGVQAVNLMARHDSDTDENVRWYNVVGSEREGLTRIAVIKIASTPLEQKNEDGSISYSSKHRLVP